MTAELPAPPRYGRASLAELLPSVLAGLGVAGEEDVLGLAISSGHGTSVGPVDKVLVLVVDGLGWHDLHDHRSEAPFLVHSPTRRLDAVFPPTTAVCLSSIGTGEPPGQHGLVGYACALPDEQQPFNLLTWRVGLRGGGRDVRDEVPPESFQSSPTVFERAGAAGIHTRVLLTEEFAGSGLTRAALRGGESVIVEGLDETLHSAVAALEGPAPRLVYAYHGAVDAAGHRHGPGSAEWRDALATTDHAVEKAAGMLPEDAQLLVTADHGMVAVPEDDVFELADDPALAAGVRVLAGEPRMRHVFTHPGQGGEVAGRWRDRVGERAVVLERDAAIEAGLFGPVADAVRPRIGEVIAISRRGTLVHRDVDPNGGRLAGHHGGLERREIEVPLVTPGSD